MIYNYAINAYKVFLTYDLLKERGTDVCTNNIVWILYIFIYHKKPVTSSHSVTPCVPLFNA